MQCNVMSCKSNATSCPRDRYAWEVDGSTAEAMTTLVIPHGYEAMKTSGGYRMIPWDSVGGEGTEEPDWDGRRR